MILLKRILVATDFSEASHVALTYGRTLARTFGASLHLLHVMENPFLRATPVDPHVFKAETMRHLGEQLTDDDRTMLGAVAALEISDYPAEAIVTFAEARQVDLVVMGTHSRGAMAQLLVGSVAEKVVRTAPCPVLTVRHPERDFVVADAPVTTAHSTPGGLS